MNEEKINVLNELLTDKAVEIIHEMSYEELKEVYKDLNCWRWPELLGEKPDGWEHMPNYNKTNKKHGRTKEDFIRPCVLEIKKLIPSIHTDVYKGY